MPLTAEPRSSETPFPLMFTPVRIGSMEVRNRIAFASVTSTLGDRGFATQDNADFLGARAAGGAGLITTEALHVHPTSNIGYGVMQIFSDAHIKPLAMLPKAVHKHGAKILGQLGHIGRQWESGYSREKQVAPSPAAAFPVFMEVAHELEPEEIHELIESFASGARRLAEAGFDGVEIHGAHGLLIQQFLSPHTNFRTDEWGGSEEGRMKFLLAIIDAVRSQVGREMVVGLKLSTEEFVPDGLHIEDCLRILQRLEDGGKLDYFLIAAGGFSSIESIHPTTHYPNSPFIANAAAVKRQSKLPIVAIGKIKDPAESEQILAEGKADIIAMARGLICDPDLPNKMRAGKQHLIRGCLSCNECHGRIWVDKRIGCTYNAAAGQERIVAETPPPSKRKRVLVIGAGPAGCEAARVAASRGHDVTLMEASQRIGGRIFIASQIREDYKNVWRYFTNTLAELDVDVRLGTRADEDAVLAFGADAVVVATGTRRHWPNVPGARAEHVLQMEETILAAKAGTLAFGKNVVVWANDHHAAPLGVAELLADFGHAVTLVTAYTYVGHELEINTLSVYHKRLVQRRVPTIADVDLTSIGTNTVELTNRYNGDVTTLPADAVVLCSPGAADPALFRALKGKVPELHLAGDAVAPRRMTSAVYEANAIARAL